MLDANDNSGAQSASQFSDDVIRRFLLGNLRDDERVLFEARFFADDELDARVCLSEFDLTDEYAFALLNPADRESYRRNFLVTNGRRRTLSVSESLRDRFAVPFTPQIKTAQGLKRLFAIRHPVLKYAFAALVLIFLIAAIWLVTKEPQLVRRFAPKPAAPKPTATATPQFSNHSSNGSSPGHHVEQSSELPAHEIPRLTVLLEPNGTIVDVAAVTIRKGNRGLVRLQLVLEKNSPRTFQAEIISQTGVSIFRADSLTASHDLKVNLDVPAHLLAGGDFQVKLSRIDRKVKSVVATYHFRVE